MLFQMPEIEILAIRIPSIRNPTEIEMLKSKHTLKVSQGNVLLY